MYLNKSNFNCIINLNGVSPDDGNISGSHWTCLSILNNNAFYFDYFGFPASIETEQFIKKQNIKHYGYNTTQIQNIKSNKCGYFCIALLLHIKNNPNNFYNTIDNFLNMFHDDTKYNDSILMKFLKKV